MSSARDIAQAMEEFSGIQLASEAERGNEVNVAVGERTRQVMAYSARMLISVNDIKHVSQKGQNNMSKLIKNTLSMESMMRRMNDRVGILNESTASIQIIVSLLIQFTKRTTILSLNASIEARAGAAGNGIAVVAEEIHRLAEQSKQSIEIADELLSTIQTEVGATVGVISEAFPIYIRQTESVQETDDIFRQVQATIQEFEENIGGIASIAHDLDLSQMQLSESLNSVNAFSQQSLAGSEEVAPLSKVQFAISEKLVAQSAQLEALSGKLKEVISQFRI